MANDTLIKEEVELQDNSWEGGKPPFKVSYGKLMMWYFLLSDAFTFAGFLIAYGAIRFSSATWPIPDVVFSTVPFGLEEYFTFWGGHAPLLFVTFMSFLLIISSVTMVRAVQEGHRENKRGVVYWMFLTILGGLGFLGCQAWEWSNLIGKEHMTVTQNPFGTHTEGGTYLEGDGHHIHKGDTFRAGDGYLIHMDKKTHEFHKLAYKTESGEVKHQEMGPKAFGALFFFITGFHGFHVFSGVVFLIIIMINVMTGLYVKRKNGYEMVEKMGLYWHFVDLVWVFVFLVFYLL